MPIDRSMVGVMDVVASHAVKKGNGFPAEALSVGVANQSGHMRSEAEGSRGPYRDRLDWRDPRRPSE